MNMPESFKDIIDKLSIKIPYFNKDEEFISKKNLEINFCKKKMKIYNDSLLDYICTNND